MQRFLGRRAPRPPSDWRLRRSFSWPLHTQMSCYGHVQTHFHLTLPVERIDCSKRNRSRPDAGQAPDQVLHSPTDHTVSLRGWRENLTFTSVSICLEFVAGAAVTLEASFGVVADMLTSRVCNIALVLV